MPRFLSLLLAYLFISTTCLAEPVLAADQPNILWIMSEDNSKHYLKHFDPSGVATPAIEALAEHGVTFDRAFSNAPVCSVARSTLITGCYAPRIGIQYHRAAAQVTLPPDLEMFPCYLRDAGYYTTNNSKTDYNARFRNDPWDESSRKASWANRPSTKTPFFHVQTHADSHESRLHFAEAQVEKPTNFSQDDVEIPPYFPDTKLFRFTAAYYRDRMNVIDDKVAQAVEKLRDAGELENTFIFYFGDHGGVLPRSKGYVFESGLHVPLVVRVPENYRHLVDRELNTRTNGFVSFIDFAPTVLQLAGIKSPDAIDGQAFLGPSIDQVEIDSRESTFSYADRMDAKYDYVRAVRVGDFKYIRYFEAHYPNALENEYRYKMLAYQQWRDQFNNGELNDVQSRFFRSRPPEVLYNVADDPHELRNLADDPVHREKLASMRDQLMNHLKATNDLSLVPEAIFLETGKANPTEFGDANTKEIATYLDTANIALQPWASATNELLSKLNSGDPWVRYWALVAASSHLATNSESLALARDDDTFVKLIRRRLLDAEPLVCGRAAELSVILQLDNESTTTPEDALIRSINRSSSPTEALQILNMAVFIDNFRSEPSSLKPGANLEPGDFDFQFSVSPKSEITRRLNYFSRPNR